MLIFFSSSLPMPDFLNNMTSFRISPLMSLVYNTIEGELGEWISVWATVDRSLLALSFFFLAEFATYLNFCRSLRFDDKPDYSYLRQLFRNLFHRQGFSYDYVFDWNMLKFVSGIARALDDSSLVLTRLGWVFFYVNLGYLQGTVVRHGGNGESQAHLVELGGPRDHFACGFRVLRGEMLNETKTSLAFGAGEIVQWFREHLLFPQFLGPSRTPVPLYALFWLLWVLHAHGSFTYMQTLNKNLWRLWICIINPVSCGEGRHRVSCIWVGKSSLVERPLCCPSFLFFLNF